MFFLKRLLTSFLFSFWFCLGATPTVFIDAGHGGTDPGTIVQGLKEAPLNFKIALELQKTLKKHKFKAVLVRSNKTISLEDCVKFISNNCRKGDILVSIHQNVPRIDRTNEILILYSKTGEKLAFQLYFAFEPNPTEEFVFFHKRELIENSRLFILNSPIPVVLVECNRLNKLYREWISLPENQSYIAHKIGNGIVKYYLER